MEKIIRVEQASTVQNILGSQNSNATAIENHLDVIIEPHLAGIRVISENQEHLDIASKILKKLLNLSSEKVPMTEQLSNYLTGTSVYAKKDLSDFHPDWVAVDAKGKPVVSKTLGQSNYVEAIEKNTVTFAIGPAGTGKTYLAVAKAVQAFKQEKVDKIILTRPAVEAGERLGFLPGDLQEKVDPYMRPLYDALSDLMGYDTYLANMERGKIEVSPLAYMRGRTLDNAFIILDEAQNTTPEQMKMFLTRLGFDSKMVITGDITQVDLMDNQRSGLVEAQRILKKVDGLEIVELDESDVVRNPMVQRIIRAYEQQDKREAKRRADRNNKSKK